MIPERDRPKVIKETIKKIRIDLKDFKIINDINDLNNNNNLSNSINNNLKNNQSNLNNTINSSLNCNKILDKLSEFEDDSDEDETEKDEVNYYLNLNFNETIKKEDACEFYSGLNNLKLKNYAISLFTCPATSNIIEQKFILASFIMNKHRNLIKPQNLNNNLFIKSNYNLIKK